MSKIIQNFKQLGAKEFMNRWKNGIKNVTPAQQNAVSINGSIMVLFGILIGLITTASNKVWWLFIILLGSFVLAGISLLGQIQKQILFKEMEIKLKEYQKLNQTGGQDEQESTRI